MVELWRNYGLEVRLELWRNYRVKKTEVQVLPVVDLAAESPFFLYFLLVIQHTCKKKRRYCSNFSIEGPGKKKKDKFPKLATAFLYRIAESNRSSYIFLSREVSSSATPP